jgi:hypothetical protein
MKTVSEEENNNIVYTNEDIGKDPEPEPKTEPEEIKIPPSVDEILSQETVNNKSETWSKLNRSLKVQLLHVFAERHGKEQKYGVKEIKSLKRFLTDSLDAKRFTKMKDISYDKEKKELVGIPGLYIHPTNRVFTLRANERPSTLKSLTPRRITEKNISSKCSSEN